MYFPTLVKVIKRGSLMISPNFPGQIEQNCVKYR